MTTKSKPLTSTYFYIPKDAIDSLKNLKDGENAILREIGNNLGIVGYRKNDTYLIRISYISGDNVKVQYQYNFAPLPF